ncbi:hypothetical protein [Vibrio sp. SCSIO 43136]|uniref:hypothetical protein n=1 Tax=Vibrio sp. SCSIO 43136 TaxID=2819101 RepID=UPI002074D3F3|nr:hypothetical protein [Vibrio sp. SCSIO 43136]USD67024.1 hypothetical protein J4N39_20520 [Vibrio sp. SCSIO 43136]
MPKVYCEVCDKVTDHKEVMRKSQTQCTTLLEKIQNANQLVFKFLSGEHYYEMERHLYCRTCNCQNVPEPNIKPTPVSAQQAA